MTKAERHNLEYKRMCQLLGELEDRLGDCEETQVLNRQLDKCMEGGHSLSLLNLSMANRIDMLNEVANVL
jgi:hypothetical protein